MEDKEMIPIILERNLPFHQTFGKRRLLLLCEATRYTDGQHKLLWLTFKNNFVETTSDMHIELTQFNRVEQVIQKSRIQIKAFICAPRLQQTIASPIIIVDQCEAVSVKIISVTFQSLDLMNDILSPAYHPLPAIKPVLPKNQQSGLLKITNPLRWLPFWVSFWMVVALILIVFTFQWTSLI
jgi:hypothetical protein